MANIVQEHTVSKCPLCGKAHRYKVTVEIDKRTPPPFFAGDVHFPERDKDSKEKIRYAVSLICAEKGEPFSDIVEISARTDEKVRYARSEPLDAAATPPVPDGADETERLSEQLKEMRQNSLNRAREYAEKLVEYNLACIGVMTTLLTFMVQDGASDGGPWTAALFSISAAFMLASVAVCACALIPVTLKPADLNDFQTLLTSLHVRLRRIVIAATALFAVGVFFAIAVFAVSFFSLF